METFRVAVIDEHFISEDDFQAADEQAALAKALRSALDIAAEQVSAGKPFFGAEVTLSRGEAVLSRMVVSVGVSPLKNG
jgi:hypothetical protein